MKKKKHGLKTNEKIKFFTLFLALFLFIFIFRLFNLQILDAYDYKNKGRNTSKIGAVIKPERGNIFDRKGNPLAVSQESENLYIMPVTSSEKSERAENIKKSDKEFNKLNEKEKEEVSKLASLPTYKPEDISRIAKILEINEADIYKYINREMEGQIFKNISKSQKSQLDLLNLGYLRYIKSNERFYPNNDVLSNTIGFIDNDEKTKYGLEKYYDNILSGKNGYRDFYKTIQGTEIPYLDASKIEPEKSSDISTTIDLDIQKMLTKILKEAFVKYLPMNIKAIVMNPNNGEILAMESLPGFDLNHPRKLESEIDQIFLNNINPEKLGEYLQSRWSNKTVSDKFDPGSVHKTITSAIALETHPELENKIYEDVGYIDIARGVRIYNYKKVPFGKMDMKKALVISSNPVFVEIARDVGVKDYIDFGNNFRYGKKTGIDLPNEVSGFFPSSYDIKNVDFATLSYGHYLNVNSFQIMSAVNSIVNGGNYYKPHLLKEVKSKSGATILKNDNNFLGRTISEKTSEIMREHMRATGEDYNLDKDLGINVSAKTGTSVKYKKETIFDVENDEEDSPVATSIYVAFPAENPKYAVYINFDEPQTSKRSSGAPTQTVKKVIKGILDLDSQNYSINNKNVKVPNIEGKTIEEAIKILENSELSLKTDEKVGKYNIISEQYPKENNLIEQGQSINITISDQIKMPNLIDIDIDQAKEILKQNKIKFKIEGNGKKIKRQSIEQGQIFNQSDEIILYTGE